MANSDSHRLGQLIGVMLEKAIEPRLRAILPNETFYLDTVNTNRNVRGKKKKVSWIDYQGNQHDLDFVIEKNGTADKYGNPKAFIECAWRRYTKHSKNKAQEIQGAILPIAEKYYIECPFKGAILAGEFKTPSLEQLNACGFTVLYIQYSSIVNAFNCVGIDISFGEDVVLSTQLLLYLQKVVSVDYIIIDYNYAKDVKEQETLLEAFIGLTEYKEKK